MNFIQLTTCAVGRLSCRRRLNGLRTTAPARQTPYGWTIVSLFLASLALAQNQGQRLPPHIGFVYPAGGRQGTTFTVSVGGQNLNGDIVATFSHPGAQAKATGYDRPLTQKEINDLREEAQKLQDKRAAAIADKTKPPFTAEDDKLAAEIRRKLATRGARQSNPVLAETVTFEVTLAPDVAPGELELRLRTPNGLSNPFVFCVGQLPEIGEPVVTVTTNPAPRVNGATGPRPARMRTDMEIALPTVVNGQILPGEVDHFRFAARKGQRIVAVVSARALIPYLADAVPGWFQATLALQDAKGRELAYDDDYRFNPDPVLCYTIPEDGNYAFEIKDAIFRGREDFVYRISIGELPFVTGVFPLGAPAGSRTTFNVTGWNLPVEKLLLDATDQPPGNMILAVNANAVRSNPVRIALDAQPEATATEPNDRNETAQSLTLPVIVNGRIDRSGDEDVFRFEGKAGTEIVAEVVARRLGSSLDSTLTLTDAAGHRLAFNDDSDDKAAAMLTHQADSRLIAKLPADGTYFVHLADAQHHGGPDFAYRLRLSPPRPDFELRVAPASINLRAGMSVPITVYALRRDGFSGEIALGLKNAPRGFTLSGARIPPNQDKIQLTLTAPPAPRAEPFELALNGLAMIDGQRVAHLAVPAEDMMQAFAYRHLVVARALQASVAGRGASAPFRTLTRTPLHLAPGATTELRVASPAARALNNVQLELADPPEGVSILSSKSAGEFVDVVLSCDPAKVKAGLQGNLIFNATGERANPNAPNPAGRIQRVPLGAVPAIPFEVDSNKAAKPAEKLSVAP